MEASKPRPCGPHIELAKVGAVRITRCACGTVHLHLARSGVSLQIDKEALAHLAQATAEARGELADAAAAANAASRSCIH